MKKFRAGILGGMGPLAGVYFQKLLIEETPAQKDQDHLEVICYTMPQVPDRNGSIFSGKSGEFVAVIKEGLEVLARAGATVGAIPCNTAHACFSEIEKNSSLPLLDMVALAVREIPAPGRAGLLSTTATITEKIYEKRSSGKISWLYPENEQQDLMMEAIYGIKAGATNAFVGQIAAAVADLRKRGADKVILGCTEFSLYEKYLESRFPGVIVDPMKILAKRLVAIAGK